MQQKQDHGKDMTFREFVRWLKKRRLLRREYSRDICKSTAKSHRLDAAIFFAAIFLLLTFCVKNADLTRKDGLTDSVYSENSVYLAGNPSVLRDAILCEVTVTVGNDAPVTVAAAAATVGDIIRDFGCEVNPCDRIVPSPDTLIRDGMEIAVIRVTYETDTILATLSYDTEYIPSQTIPKGTTELISEGKNGSAEQDVRYRYENGVFAETEIIASRTIEEPVPEKCYQGVGGMIGKLSYNYYIDVVATCYGPTGNLTYTGVEPHFGVIAVDPTVIPLHTKCYVTGDYMTVGVCYAEDIGGGIKGKRIDVFMDEDYDTLMQFGRRDMRLYVLD